VLCRQSHDERLTKDHVGGNFRIVNVIGIQEGSIQGAVSYSLENVCLGQVGTKNRQYVRKLLPQEGQQYHEDPSLGTGDKTNGNLADLVSCRLACELNSTVQVLEHYTDPSQKNIASLGQADIALPPTEERRADDLLQLADLPAERRLRCVETLRRMREIPLLSNGNKKTKIPKIHRAPLAAEPDVAIRRGWQPSPAASLGDVHYKEGATTQHLQLPTTS
jgi:hypothetical protein